MKNFIDAIISVPGAIIGIFLFVIPTFFFNPNHILPDIEKDLDIDLPEEYIVVDKHKEFLIFEENLDVTLQFDSTHFSLIHDQIKEKPNDWKKEKSVYNFKKEVPEKRFGVEAELNEENKTLFYKFYTL